MGISTNFLLNFRLNILFLSVNNDYSYNFSQTKFFLSPFMLQSIILGILNNFHSQNFGFLINIHLYNIDLLD